MNLVTAGGCRFRVRPVRPSDEPAVLLLLQQLSPEEIRLRFFCCMRCFSHELLERLTHIDNAGQLGLIAMAEEGKRDDIIASAMLVPEPDGVAAEFAVLVHHDYAHHGLGRVLIEQLIAHARMQKIRQVYGWVLAENDSMLQLASEMGFCARADPDNRDTIRVEFAVAQPA